MNDTIKFKNPVSDGEKHGLGINVREGLSGMSKKNANHAKIKEYDRISKRLKKKA